MWLYCIWNHKSKVFETAGLQKVYPHFSVMPHGLVHESEEKLRAHFFHTGTPSATGLSSRARGYHSQMLHEPIEIDALGLCDPRLVVKTKPQPRTKREIQGPRRSNVGGVAQW